jgi:hypothetical protein
LERGREREREREREEAEDCTSKSERGGDIAGRLHHTDSYLKRACVGHGKVQDV